MKSASGTPAQQRQRARAALLRREAGGGNGFDDGESISDAHSGDSRHTASLPLAEFDLQRAALVVPTDIAAAVDFFSALTTSWVVDGSIEPAPATGAGKGRPSDLLDAHLWRTWSSIAAATHIRELTVTKAPLDTAARVLPFASVALVPCAGAVLRHLALPFTELADEGFVAVACAIARASPNSAALETLDVSNNRLTARCLETIWLLMDAVPTVVHLRLRGNDLSHDHGALVDLVLDRPELRSLDVGFCTLPSQVAEAALSALPTSGIVVANFDAAHVTVNFAMTLADALATNFTLMSLSLHHTSTSSSRAFKDRLRKIEDRNIAQWLEKQLTASGGTGRSSSLSPSPFLVLDDDVWRKAEQRLSGEAATLVTSESTHHRLAPEDVTALPRGYAAYRCEEPSRASKRSLSPAVALQSALNRTSSGSPGRPLM